jgi:hypothetical protein
MPPYAIARSTAALGSSLGSSLTPACVHVLQGAPGTAMARPAAPAVQPTAEAVHAGSSLGHKSASTAIASAVLHSAAARSTGVSGTPLIPVNRGVPPEPSFTRGRTRRMRESRGASHSSGGDAVSAEPQEGDAAARSAGSVPPRRVHVSASPPRHRSLPLPARQASSAHVLHASTSGGASGSNDGRSSHGSLAIGTVQASPPFPLTTAHAGCTQRLSTGVPSPPLSDYDYHPQFPVNVPSKSTCAGSSDGASSAALPSATVEPPSLAPSNGSPWMPGDATSHALHVTASLASSSSVPGGVQSTTGEGHAAPCGAFEVCCLHALSSRSGAARSCVAHPRHARASASARNTDGMLQLPVHGAGQRERSRADMEGVAGATVRHARACHR